MKIKPPLFRSEVQNSPSRYALGNVLLAYPVSSFFIVGTIGVLASLCFFILLTTTYTRRETVSGVIEPNQGLINLYSQQSGTLSELYIKEGARVKKGQILAILSSMHSNKNGENVAEELERQLLSRLKNARNLLENQDVLEMQDISSAKNAVATLAESKSQQISEIESQQHRLVLVESTLKKYLDLQKAGYISEMQIQQKQDEVLENKIKLQDAKRVLVNLTSEIDKAVHEINTIPIKAKVSHDQIEQNISNMESELSRQRSEHEWSVRAPCDGTVSTIVVKENQDIRNNTAILTITPSGVLHAKLYASSKSVGFLKNGELVKIKIEAFPYQKFGFVHGRVTSVAGNAVELSSLGNGVRTPLGLRESEPLYEIRVALDKQYIPAYGRSQALRSGMQLSADIELETRVLYEWLLEPIYGLKQS